VGIDNKGEVSAKGANNLVVGNTINSGKVILAAKNGKIMDVANLPGAEVVIESGTWLFEGHTRNEGVVHVKSGKFTGHVKENAGTIIIDSGVKGKVVFCKAGSGTIQNNAKAEISINADAAFCREVVKPAPSPKPPIPEFFYCRDSAKYATTVFQTAEESGSGELLCGAILDTAKSYFEAFKYEMDAPNPVRFFSRCCGAAIKPPKGKKYILKEKSIKKKVVKASTIVNIDFTSDNNKDAREKFEKVFTQKAKAKSGKFDYRHVAQSDRRRVAVGTVEAVSAKIAVSATLEYEDDATAQAGQEAVSAPSFATKVSADLKHESVDITLAATSATIEEVEEMVVEELLVDDSGSEVTQPKTPKPESPKQTSPKPASKKPGTSPKPAFKKPETSPKPASKKPETSPKPANPKLIAPIRIQCCEHKGRCSKEMTKRQLTCDSDTQQ
jgi:hypothetical protein